jgi:hypothetical protein
VRRRPCHRSCVGACSPLLDRGRIDRLEPVCAQLLGAAVDAGDIRPGTQPYELMRGIGNLCIGRDSDPRYDPRRLIELLLQGLRQAQPA